MSLSYFGSNGAYNMDPLNQAMASGQAMMNAYHGSTGINGTVSTTFTGTGILGGLYYSGQGLGQIALGQSMLSQTLSEYTKIVAAPVKKAARGVLAKLRTEIDGWHADILERQAV